MRYFPLKRVGRTFIIRLERGDCLLESIAEICEREQVFNAIVSSGIATFDEVQMQMTNTDDYPIKYDRITLKQPLELAALDGTVIDKVPHLHAVVSTYENTWAGHVLEGCRILYLGEIVIQELLGADLVRKPDINNVNLISVKNS